MRFRRFLLIVGGVCLGLALAEVCARALLLVRPGGTPVLRRDPVAVGADATTFAGRIPLVHPYFGVSPRRGDSVFDGPVQFQLPLLRGLDPVDDGWRRLRTNNQGFYSEHDYPYAGSPDEYIVGVFGGSVSNYFGVVESTRLASLIEAIPTPRRRRVVVLNFAQNGYKQPQQALILTYFLAIGQRLDAVVNIDGFNEAALGFYENWGQGLDVSMPRAYPGGLVERLANPSDAQIAWQASMVSIRRTSGSLDAWARTTPSAAVRLAIEGLQTVVNYRAQRLAARRPAAASAAAAGFFAVPKHGEGVDAAMTQVTDLWVAGSRTMHDICAARGIRYVHLLQPNQYYSKHPFSDDERRVAIADAHPYRESVRRLYPAMQGLVAQLRQAGIDAVDGIGLFDAEAAPVFADDCCHYTRKGYDLVADRIARQLAMPPDSSRRAASY